MTGPAPNISQPHAPESSSRSLGDFFARDSLRRLAEPVDSASAGFFRFWFGLILLWESVEYLARGWVYGSFLAPKFLFKYVGFEWVEPWPDGGLYIHFVVMGLAATAVMLGWRYRVFMPLFWACWTYVVLLEKADYNNHFYLVSTTAFVMSFLPLNRSLALDARSATATTSATIPRWVLLMLQFQIGVPYVFGAIAKWNGDWLQGQPMQMWMSQMTHIRAVFPLYGDYRFAVLMSWGGMLFDLLIVPALIWKRTRRIAYFATLLFHLMNACMFDIGIFPWFMIGASTIFFPPEWPRRWLPRMGNWFGEPTPPNHCEALRTWQLCGWGLYVAVQLLLPFRHWCYPGNVDWTDEGRYFAWRMMLVERHSAFRIVAIDRETGLPSHRHPPAALNPAAYLRKRQIDHMSIEPEMMQQFARFLREVFLANDWGDVEFRFHVLCSLNGRKPEWMIDPHIDLAVQPERLAHRKWILPQTEPLDAAHPWLVPQSEWERLVPLPLPAESSRSMKTP